MTNPVFHYVCLIDAPPAKVWQALTTAEFTRQYWHGTEVRSDWTVGSKVEFLVDSGEIGCEGEVLACTPNKRLCYSWHFPRNPATAGEVPSKVSFDLEEIDGATKLTVTHDGFPGPESVTYQMASTGWPFVLAGLKTLCEQGETRDFSALHMP